MDFLVIPPYEGWRVVYNDCYPGGEGNADDAAEPDTTSGAQPRLPLHSLTLFTKYFVHLLRMDR